MGKPDVLDRVTTDLSRGHTQPALQRLSSLVAAHPTDLDLRRRLAAVHRMVGNRIEAGRWDYLSPAADPAETSAFERAYPTAGRRLHALRWPRGAGAAATEYARARLDALARSAAAEASTDRSTGQSRAARWIRDATPATRAVLAVVAVTLGLLVVLGAVTVVQWII